MSPDPSGIVAASTPLTKARTFCVTPPLRCSTRSTRFSASGRATATVVPTPAADDATTSIVDPGTGGVRPHRGDVCPPEQGWEEPPPTPVAFGDDTVNENDLPAAVAAACCNPEAMP